MTETLYKCYSVPQKKYLLNSGFKYSWVGVNPKNSKTFWTFIITDELSRELEKWSANKPVRV